MAAPQFKAFPEKWDWDSIVGKGNPQKKSRIFYDNLPNSKHDIFPNRNYDNRVGARIISQKIKTMNNS